MLSGCIKKIRKREFLIPRHEDPLPPIPQLCMCIALERLFSCKYKLFCISACKTGIFKSWLARFKSFPISQGQTYYYNDLCYPYNRDDNNNLYNTKGWKCGFEGSRSLFKFETYSILLIKSRAYKTLLHRETDAIFHHTTTKKQAVFL